MSRDRTLAAGLLAVAETLALLPLPGRADPVRPAPPAPAEPAAADGAQPARPVPAPSNRAMAARLRQIARPTSKESVLYRNDVQVYRRLLEESPDALEYRWLLNIAHMTVGEYPQGVPD